MKSLRLFLSIALLSAAVQATFAMTNAPEQRSFCTKIKDNGQLAATVSRDAFWHLVDVVRHPKSHSKGKVTATFLGLGALTYGTYKLAEKHVPGVKSSRDYIANKLSIGYAKSKDAASKLYASIKGSKKAQGAIGGSAALALAGSVAYLYWDKIKSHCKSPKATLPADNFVPAKQS